MLSNFTFLTNESSIDQTAALLGEHVVDPVLLKGHATDVKGPCCREDVVRVAGLIVGLQEACPVLAGRCTDSESRLVDSHCLVQK